MVDPRWLDIIEKFEGIEGLRPESNINESGQSDTNLPSNAAPSNRRKLALTLSGAMVVVFIVLMMFVAT